MQIGIPGPSDDDPFDEDLELDPDLGEALDLEADNPGEHWLAAVQPTRPGSRVDGWLSRLDDPIGSDDSAARIAAIAASAFLTTGVDLNAGGIRGSYRRWTFAESVKDVDLLVVLTPPSADHLDLGEGAAPERTRRLIRLLKHWNHVATEPQPSIRIELKIRAARVASSAVRAAYAARHAVVHEEPATSRQVVARFVANWLGLRPTAAMVEAAGNALLQAPLTLTDHEPAPDLIERLRIDTLLQRRAWRPIGETQVRGRLVNSLDRPLHRVGAEAPLTVADKVGAGDPPTDAVDGWNDGRLPRVLAGLRPDELQVAMTYVHADRATTWSAAARTCGMPASFGDRVRRKLKRLGDDLVARIAAQGLPRPA